ncbi:hypothetical protein D918_04077 [Trichuris suis]|nr:hypothetical protein D918_04077 [Trichuris suis]
MICHLKARNHLQAGSASDEPEVVALVRTHCANCTNIPLGVDKRLKAKSLMTFALKQFLGFL